jgi:Fic/DOC family
VPSWDEDSPQLRQNLSNVFDELVLAAQRREYPSVASARRWQSLLMEKLSVPDARFVGAFRGERGLERIQVRVGAHYGVNASEVAEELAGFERKLHALIRELDAMLPANQEPNADQFAAVLDLCAWVHAEWVRIHPFANGNGRTARFWANCIAVRYGLPPFIRLRPRPNYGYGEAGAKAMQGDWKPTAIVLRQLLSAFLDGM